MFSNCFSTEDFKLTLTSKGVSKFFNFYTKKLQKNLFSQLQIPNIKGSHLINTFQYDVSNFKVQKLNFTAPKFSISKEKKIFYHFQMKNLRISFDIQIKKIALVSVDLNFKGIFSIKNLNLKSKISIDETSRILKLKQENIDTEFDKINFELENVKYVNYIIGFLEPYIQNYLKNQFMIHRIELIDFMNEKIHETNGDVELDEEYKKMMMFSKIGFEVQEGVIYGKNKIIIPFKFKLKI